jgi:nucleoside-diphosphate-sugar epimerase
MTTLVTGAAGFIGMHTAAALLKQGETVAQADGDS